MASDVDICNLALAHLGDNATIASIDPPEGSAQAEHCARFFPIARDALLEMKNWSFASRRALLPQLTACCDQWDYIYGLPADCMRPVSVLPNDAEDDYVSSLMPSDIPWSARAYAPAYQAGYYAPQPYQIETNSSGQKILMTNQEQALLRYQAYVTDSSVFPPLFVTTLSWHLASMLAGPVIKGDAGAAEAKRCMEMMAAFLSQASNSDAEQRDIRVEHLVGWMSGR